MRTMYRQGDVLLVGAEAALRPKLRRVERARLAEGEATGHAHVLERTPGAELLEGDSDFVRIVGAACLLVHQEHGSIEIPPGDYRVVRQRVYAPSAYSPQADAPQESRPVAD
jgi:hypothetical protein